MLRKTFQNTLPVCFMGVMAFLLTSCGNKQSFKNLDVVAYPDAQHIVAPGMNSIGIIKDELVYIYYFTESGVWDLDQDSQFIIPPKNEGLLTPGMGTFAIVRDDLLYFFNMDASMRWDGNYELTMPLPDDFIRLSAMKMPYQRGVIAIENSNNTVDFFYLDEEKMWQKDETATFALPEGIDNYLMLGSMDLAIISENKLGIYRLNLSGDWVFQDDLVLTLPEGFDAVLAYEPGVISVLKDGVLQFFEVDFENRYWLLDDLMNFKLPEL
jgi:hypothetical protein